MDGAALTVGDADAAPVGRRQSLVPRGQALRVDGALFGAATPRRGEPGPRPGHQPGAVADPFGDVGSSAAAPTNRSEQTHDQRLARRRPPGWQIPIPYVVLPDRIDVIAWLDPPIERCGFPPHHAYVELLWLPTIGPTANVGLPADRRARPPLSRRCQRRAHRTWDLAPGTPQYRRLGTHPERPAPPHPLRSRTLDRTELRRARQRPTTQRTPTRPAPTPTPRHSPRPRHQRTRNGRVMTRTLVATADGGDERSRRLRPHTPVALRRRRSSGVARTNGGPSRPLARRRNRPPPRRLAPDTPPGFPAR